MFYHFYADDTQLYFPLKPSDPSSLHKLKSCLTDIKSRMSQNVLKVNDNKCEVILFGPQNLVQPSNNVTQAARNLGVIVFQLKIISKMLPYLLFLQLLIDLILFTSVHFIIIIIILLFSTWCTITSVPLSVSLCSVLFVALFLSALFGCISSVKHFVTWLRKVLYK